MFPVMLLNSVLCAMFAFCGLVGAVVFFANAERGMSMAAFLHGFTSMTWPLLVSSGLLMLQCILREVSALREAAEQKKHTAFLPTTAKSTAPEAPEEMTGNAPAAPPVAAKPEPVYFPVRETPQGPRIVRPAEQPSTPAEPKTDGLTFFKTR